MTTFRTSTLFPLGAALALTGCAEPEDSSGPGGDITTTAGTADESTTAAETTAEQTTEETTDDSGETAAVDGVTAAGLAAIATAESEAGGIAFAIDRDDDDGTWDVDVRTGDSMVEIEVSADGASVLTTEDDDLDDDDRAATDAATVTLAEAIEIALGETGGVLDDAEIDDDAPVHYEVSLDVDGRDDVDVDVDAATGEVLRVS